MSNSVSFLGLNDRAKAVLKSGDLCGVEVGTRVYSNGRRVKIEERPFCESYSREAYDTIFTGLGEFDMDKFLLPDGRVYFEFEQAMPAYNGSDVLCFTALKDATGQVVLESIWSEEEMTAAYNKSYGSSYEKLVEELGDPGEDFGSTIVI